MLLACAMPSAAEDNDSYYYYKIRFVTKLQGDDSAEELTICYAAHGQQTNNQYYGLTPCFEDGNPVDFFYVPNMSLLPGEREKADVFLFRWTEPLIGLRLFAEDPNSSKLTWDETQYYLPLELEDQQPGVQNALTVNLAYRIEGFDNFGVPILSQEAMDPAFTSTYDAPPKFSGLNPDDVFYTTQKLTVTDSNLASVTLDGEPVSFEGNTAVVTLPGDTDALYYVAAQDANGSLSQIYIEMLPLGVLMNPVAELELDNVKPYNAEDIEDVIANVLDVMDTPHITAEETDVLREMEALLRALLARIDEAEACRNSESILDTQHITAENVTPADREALLAAKADLERALRDYSGNYTDGTLNTIRSDLDRVNAALAALDKSEEDLAGMPKTGDDSSAMLWCVFLAMSAAGILMLRKRSLQ